jgi:hypothetical protein
MALERLTEVLSEWIAQCQGGGSRLNVDPTAPRRSYAQMH